MNIVIPEYIACHSGLEYPEHVEGSEIALIMTEAPAFVAVSRKCLKLGLDRHK
jgi:hypothetical protein